MGNVSDKISRENQNSHFMFSNFFFTKILPFEIMWEKYGGFRQATDDNIMLRIKDAIFLLGY